jgi:hypothetical protein
MPDEETVRAEVDETPLGTTLARAKSAYALSTSPALRALAKRVRLPEAEHGEPAPGLSSKRMADSRGARPL